MRMLPAYKKIITHETPESKTSLREVGGKAFNLFKLRGFGFRVPDWFVLSSRVFDELIRDREAAIVSILSEIDHDNAESYERASSLIGGLIVSVDLTRDLEIELLDHLSDTLDNGSYFSVRSSVTGEDSSQNSFAGQMDSFLCVGRENVLDAVKKVWASAYSARSLAYRHAKKVSPSDISAAVIIQNMLQPETSGVLFTRDPENLAPQCCISAAYGLGEGVVSDRVVSDTYRLGWSSSEIEKNVADKDLRVMQDWKKQTGTFTEALPADMRKKQVLTDSRVHELRNTGIQIERSFKAPQDIEWAYDRNGKLFILQSRPITSPAASKGTEKCRIWDNSNIVESYPGLTLPLTFSFILRGYEYSFKRAIQGLVVNKKILNEVLPVFRNMLGLIDGRVYYNLLNWYQMLSYLPGFRRHKESWDQMIGIQESVDFPGTRLSTVNKAYSWLKIAHLLLSVKRCGQIFGSNFSNTYIRIRDYDLSRAREHDLAHIFDEASHKFSDMWHFTLYNDFAAMKYYDWLKILTSDWGPGDRPNIHNDLLCGVHGLESIEPLRTLVRLAEKVRSSEVFRRLFESEEDGAVWREIDRNAQYCELRSSFKNYLKKYGDRCLEDLKLEKANYHEKPEQLVELVRNYYQSGMNVGEMERRESKVRQEAEWAMKRHLKNPLKRSLYFFVLKNTRLAIANRENMRFARSRLYGFMRQIFLRMGELFEKKELLDTSRDIFYLTLDEIFGTVHATSITEDLKSTVRVRRSEYRTYGSRSPKERIITTGIPRLNRIHGSEKIPGKSSILTGTGCSSGITEGPARVGFDPSTVIPGPKYILVARSTDPGWVFLMISSAGIIAEKGSVLSHTAIIGRELGIPTIVGVKNATSIIQDGSLIRMDGSKGEIRCL
jgi:pyruvate,water dikinase